MLDAVPGSKGEVGGLVNVCRWQKLTAVVEEEEEEVMRKRAGNDAGKLIFRTNQLCLMLILCQALF